jgi:hypothetical protein
MKDFRSGLLVTFAIALACQAAYAAESAPENCFVAHAKAEARTAKAASDKALKLLPSHRRSAFDRSWREKDWADINPLRPLVL